VELPPTHDAPPVSQSLQDYNRSRVIEALRASGSATRAQLRSLTGLSRATLTKVVDRLIREGVAAETDAVLAASADETRSRGRPARAVKLTSGAGLVVGIAFGHSELWAASADLSGTILREHREPLAIDNSAKSALDVAADLLNDLIVSSARGTTTADQIVVGLPCPVNSQTGRIVTNNILPGWVDVHPAGEMRSRTGQQVVIENDANLAALGEWRYGAGRDLANLIYVKASIGIGAGLILDNRLYRGAAGTAGEIGHTQINPDGTVCRCGNRGCLETIASLRPVLVSLSEAHGRAVDYDGLVALLAAGDIGARRVVADAGRRIGRPLADLCNALNPGLVVVGGELGNAGAALTDAIHESINRYAQPLIGQVTAQPSTLGPRAEMLGAVAAAIAGTRPAPH
jgi:predicted NBD/HSP70 family sugar kinase